VQATIVPWHHRHDRPKVATAPERSYLKDRKALNAISDPEADGPPPTVRLVQNWYEEFRDREQD